MQVIGKNCRLLQGKGTERRKVGISEVAGTRSLPAAAANQTEARRHRILQHQTLAAGRVSFSACQAATLLCMAEAVSDRSDNILGQCF